MALLVAWPAAADRPPAGGAACWPGAPGSDPALCPPDDPRYARRWEFGSTIPDTIDRNKLHPREAALGSIGFSLDAAWQLTTGRDDVVIAVLDSGIRWHERDLVRKLYLNPGELPPPEGSADHDGNDDGVFDIDDYASDSRVGDRNGNGMLDPEDLILSFSDCVDDDGNGYSDDISGYDFFGTGHCGSTVADNNPRDETDFGHGTGIASTAAAETNNGIGDAGVCPRCRVLPVRVGDSFVVDANQFARGVTFAVHGGATVIASALGSYNNTPAARHAIDEAYARGVAVIASAADEFSYHHNFPSVYNHTVYVNAVRYNHADDPRRATTFWGVNPCTNYGARVWITVPALSCSSGATSRLAGVVGLIQSAARDVGLEDLQAEEVYQILRSSADDLDNREPDWGPSHYVARAGFDQYYGHGRLNALRAVIQVREGQVPPAVDLADPDWFAIVAPRRQPKLPVHGTIRLPRARRAEYRLEYALGVEPAESDYVRVAEGVVDGEFSGRLGTLDFAALPHPTGPAPRDRDDRDRYSVTLRLRAGDDRGLVGEARRSFFVFDDATWLDPFPLALGASGEATPLLVDVDDDGRDEIVLPTADGRLRIVHWDEQGLRTSGAWLDAGPPLRPGGPAVHDTVVRQAAVGDLAGDGRMNIVVASRNGRVYAWDTAGRPRPGFPVAIDPARSRPATKDQVIESGILSRPVLADLDGRPGLEIVVSALDGHLYAWRHDGGAVPGFPLAVEDPRRPGRRAKIVSATAVGDLDGDGLPEVVVGTNGLRAGLAAAFAFSVAGPDGTPRLLPGWGPFELPAVRGDLLPTIATGAQMDPLLVDADGDGDVEVFLYAVTGSSLVLVDHAGEGRERRAKVLSTYALTPGPRSAFRDTYFLGGTGSPALADADGDGVPELYAPLLPFRMLTLRTKPGVPIDVPLALGGWPVAGPTDDNGNVEMLPGFPRRMEDLMIMARPATADVDGDGRAEILMGSGGYLIHAFKVAGDEAAAFPKFTGGWTFSAPALGDLDGDGTAELVSVTREGYLFAWRLGSAPQAAAARPD